MSRRNVISAIISEQLAAANSSSPAPSQRTAAGPVRSMGLALDRLELERKSLEDAVMLGGAGVELDPTLIEMSFASDRLTDENDPDFEALKQSIADHGQEVPILVRPLPNQPGRYQAAYGHRRLRACHALGRNVRALIRQLTDAELVVAQGLENASRVDLTFIERASFAKGLEKGGFDRSTIMAALSTDKTELSKMLTAVSAIPDDLIRAIGRAPKAGRRRWLELAECLVHKGSERRIRSLIAQDDFAKSDSNKRFSDVLDVAQNVTASMAANMPVRTDIKANGGIILARIKETRERLDIQVDRSAQPGFADFLVQSLPDLYGQFLQEQERREQG
jgi:ParB family transcriptional regulator, chromosome partitioning protein